jgi:hypothetical protein
MNMNMSEIVGSIGVAILLISFALTAMGRLRGDSTLNLMMNLSGAATACAASAMIAFKPFVVLEGAWAITAALSLIRRWRASAQNE